MVRDIPLAPPQHEHWTKQEAERYCRDLAKTHYENFTVGSFFVPRELRQHMYNIYAFCRHSDDLGDEVGDPNRSLELLGAWEHELDQCYQGVVSHPVYVALQETIAKFDLPKAPFWRLIQAFKQDQTKTRFQTFSEVLNYCEYSANPVGHLVLYLFGYRDPERQKLSDFTCTALQLANFWQDVDRDLAIGRIYLPLEDLHRFKVTEEDLKAKRATKEFKALMAFQVDRTQELFYHGLALVKQVKGLFKIDLEAFSLGGLAVLKGIEKVDYDVLSTRPVVSRGTKLKITFSLFKSFIFG